MNTTISPADQESAKQEQLRMFQSLQRQTAALAAIALGMGGGVCAAESKVDAILKILPADAAVALIIPSLKTLSDQLTQTLEGMDRANVLLGSRPLDQAKSATGFNVGIDDAGGLAIVLSSQDVQKDFEHAPLTFVVAVNDSDAFLQGNFSRRENDAYVLPDGQKVFARVIGSHVILSASADGLAEYHPGEGLRPALNATLGDQYASLLERGEALFLIRRPALAAASHQAKRHAAKGGAALPGAAATALSLADRTEIALVVFDFDPLGLIARSWARLISHESAGHVGPGEPEAIKPHLGLLPSKPFYFSMSMDVSRIKPALEEIGVANVPEWVRQSQAVQFAAYPSPLGMQGGLLNDAVVIFETSRPEIARAQLKQQLLELQSRNDGTTRQVKYEENRKINDEIGAADAYEIKSQYAADEQLTRALLDQVLFGRGGCRGFVRATSDALIVTFSQRPAVLDAAIQSAAAATAKSGAGLATMPAIKTIRNWLPPQLALEAYLSVGQFGQILRQLPHVPGLVAAGSELPEIEPNVPPIGFGLSIQVQTVETAMVVPSGVLAVIVDQASALWRRRGVEAVNDNGQSRAQP